MRVNAIQQARDGDVVTLEKGDPQKVGYIRMTVAVDGNSLEALGGHEPLSLIMDRVSKFGWTVAYIERPEPVVPNHPGALALVDQPSEGLGVAIGTGGGWSDGGGAWTNLVDPVEALPVPAGPLRELIAAWHSPSFDLDESASAFLLACEGEWARAGITP